MDVKKLNDYTHRIYDKIPEYAKQNKSFMDILSVVELNHKLAIPIMVFLRIVTIFFFLPIFGDQVVSCTVKIVLGLAFTFFFIYPVVSEKKILQKIMSCNRCILL